MGCCKSSDDIKDPVHINSQDNSLVISNNLREDINIEVHSDLISSKTLTKRSIKANEHKEKGNTYFRAKNFDKALEEYDKAIVFSYNY